MARLDLAGYFDDDSVEIPGITSPNFPGGKTYKFASPDAKTGMWLANLADLGIRSNQGADIGEEATKLELDDNEERDLMKMVMGNTLQEMVADGVSWVRIQKLNRYLFIHFAMGEEVAGMMAKRLGEAPAPTNRAVRRGIEIKKKKTPAKSVTLPVSNAGSTTPNKKKV
mgnify:FL=1